MVDDKIHHCHRTVANEHHCDDEDQFTHSTCSLRVILCRVFHAMIANTRPASQSLCGPTSRPSHKQSSLWQITYCHADVPSMFIATSVGIVPQKGHGSILVFCEIGRVSIIAQPFGQKIHVTTQNPMTKLM